MELQYDSKGKPTAVLIPIAEWNDLASKHDDLKELTPKVIIEKKKGAGQFRGILTAEETTLYHNHIKQARSEWDRDI